MSTPFCRQPQAAATASYTQSSLPLHRPLSSPATASTHRVTPPHTHAHMPLQQPHKHPSTSHDPRRRTCLALGQGAGVQHPEGILHREELVVQQLLLGHTCTARTAGGTAGIAGTVGKAGCVSAQLAAAPSQPSRSTTPPKPTTPPVLSHPPARPSRPTHPLVSTHPSRPTHPPTHLEREGPRRRPATARCAPPPVRSRRWSSRHRRPGGSGL